MGLEPATAPPVAPAGDPVGRSEAGRAIRLVATDLDGTLLGYHPQFGVYSAFRDTIDDLRRTNRAYWAICTGRSLSSFRAVFKPLLRFGVAPDFVIVQHAYLFSCSRLGYTPHWGWNLKVLALRLRHRILLRRQIPHLRRMVSRAFPFVRVTRMGSSSVTFRFDTSDIALMAANMLRREVIPMRFLQVFHYRDEVDLRPVPFTKGLSLAELGRHLEIAPEQTLVIGDGHNDVSMMTPNVAAYTGCPLNAQPEVIEFVSRIGGHVASQKALTGVIECIEAHVHGHVDSSLPEGWEHAAARDNPFVQRSSSSREGKTLASHIRSAILFAAAAYAALVVFAHFGLVPFAGPILKPYSVLLRVVLNAASRLFDRLY